MAEDAAARLAWLASAEGGDIDVKELLDAVLLASAWDHADQGSEGPPSDAADAADPQEKDQGNTAVPTADPQALASEDAANTASVWLKDEAGAHIIPGKRVSVGRATALPDALDIGRALRPLRRPWLTGVHRRLDVDATVEHYTRTGMLIPRLTPAPEPWLEVIIVLDRGTAMAVWDEAVRALTKLLRALAAFRDVRVWHLDHPPGDSPVLHDHHGRALSMDPDAAHHTQPARRLLLIVSDCAAPAWRQDTLWRTIHTWGRTAPVALINPLPRRLWQRSGLDLPHTTATATAPASPGRLLSYRRPRLLRETDETKPWQALPVLQFAPDQVLAWTRTLMRTDPAGCEAVLVPATGRFPLRRRQQGPIGEPEAPLTNDQVRAHAEAFTDDRQSPAVRLAIAASPLGSFTLPVLDVLRDRLVPEATMADTAEFLTASLLTADRRESADTVYHFQPAAAAHLTSLLTRDQLWATHFALSDHLAACLQAPHGIPVVLHSLHADETLPTGIRPIAYAAGTTARLLGVEPTDPQPESRRGPAVVLPRGSSSEPQPGAAPAIATMLHDNPQATELYRTLARHFRALLARLSGGGADYTSGPEQRPSARGISDPTNREEALSDPLAVGAMELVGLERLRRRLPEDELLGLVRAFESTASDLVESLNGLYFKPQGGGARYLAADTRTAAEIALRLIETLASIETMPELRVGMAFGAVTMRTGDAVGRAATLASRLASVAPKDAALVDSAFADEVIRAGDAPASEAEVAEAADFAGREGDEPTSYRYALQPMWQRPLRGLGVVEPWLLTRRMDALSAPRVVGALPLSDEAAVVTSATDVSVTGRQIDAAQARVPQHPSQDRQPEQEPVGRHGTTQGWGGGPGERIPFLARLEQQDRADLLALGSQITFNARTPLLQQHEPSSHILIIVSGWAKVTAATASGYEALLNLFGPGDLVGEEVALTGRPRSATVTALEPVRAVAVPGDRFTNFLQKHPGASHHLLGLTADRVQLADRRRVELASMSVRERLASLLLDLARTHGRRTREGIELALPLTTQELAGSVGASRETMQRLLRELREQNIVTTGRRSIKVLRPDRLRALAGSEGSPGGSADLLSPHPGQEDARSGVSKGIQKVEVAIKWDPSPAGQPPTDLDLVAAAYVAGDLYGDPAYVVHFDSRSPDSTMHLNRTSDHGAGFGWDEVMTLELDRLAGRYARVLVGVVVQQHPVHRTFGDVLNPALRIREGYTVLDEDDFSGVLEATAVTVAEFVRDGSGSWTFRAGIHGIEAFDGGTASFTAVMGRMHER